MIVFILGGAFMLGLCIFIHELGHYVLARFVGVKAEIFSIGYGKGRWKKKIGDTTWQITAIPLGGYVKFYGESEPGRKQQGSFYSIPPLKRIIPVLGGPLFNLLLGLLILLLLHHLSGPLAPRIVLAEEEAPSPAQLAGLRNGDLVKSIDDKKVRNFMEMAQIVALSKGETMDFVVERNAKLIQYKLNPEVSSTGLSSIGLRMPGERYLQVNYPAFLPLRYQLWSWLGLEKTSQGGRALPYLKDGDILLSVEGHKLSSPKDLRKILGDYHGQKVKVSLLRERFPWLAPWPKVEKIVEVPTYPEYIIHIKSLRDEKYKTSLESEALYSAFSDHQRALNFITINGQAPGSFESLYKRHSPSSKKRHQIQMGERSFSAHIETQKIGLMGFQPSTLIYPDYLDSHPSFWDAWKESLRDLYNNIMLYPAFFQGLFSGRLSFLDNAAGPVRIFGAAGMILETGFQNYLHLFAAISIALFIMNLLPFPVVDGGHIVLFLYEHFAGKPLPLKVRENLHRIGVLALLAAGLIIMYQDIQWLLS